MIRENCAFFRCVQIYQRTSRPTRYTQWGNIQEISPEPEGNLINALAREKSRGRGNDSSK